MRWFCVAPDLPAKASLRIRAAPNSDADVCGRFSKGKAVAALSEVFEIADNDAAESQHWLHVTFPDEVSGEWVQGFVMTQLPNGMTLLVPWEDAGFYSCCNITSDRAVVYEGPEAAAQAVGYVGEGEGTRFPYGVREMDGTRLRIFHDVHERVWVDAADVEPVCERLEHPKCTASHSFYALNEELPPEAQIAVRVFPSRDAETRALLNRGQVIEVEMRCGSWLKIAGNPESWIMWRTDTWQLLSELPFHSSGSCVLVNEADMGGEDLPDDPMLTDEHMDGGPLESRASAEANTGVLPEGPWSSTENQDMEVDPSPSGEALLTESATASSHDTSSEQDHGTRKNSSSVTSLCDGLASHDISGHDEEIFPEDSAIAHHAPIKEGLPTVELPWDERPVGVRSQTQSGSMDMDDEPMAEGDEVSGVHAEASQLNPESTSWEERPITTSRVAYDWEDRPLNVESHSVPDQTSPAVDSGAPIEANPPLPTSSSWEERPIAQARDMYDWEERPLIVKNQALPDGSETADGAETIVEPTDCATVAIDAVSESTSREDQPSSHSLRGHDWEERLLNGAQPVRMDGDDDSQVTVETHASAVPIDSIEPTAKSSTWEDRPISKSSGVYDWESAYPPPPEDAPIKKASTPLMQGLHTETSGGVPEQVGEQDMAESSLPTLIESNPPAIPTETPQALSSFHSTENTDQNSHQSEQTISWEDRPISTNRGVYDWESAIPPSDGTTNSADSAAAVNGASDARHADAEALEENLNEAGASRKDSEEWHWDKAPIKSRHARKAALGTDSAQPPADAVHVKDFETDREVQWDSTRETLAARRKTSSIVLAKREHLSASTTALSESSPKHPAVGVVSSEDNSVAWHSIDTTEDPAAFEERDSHATEGSNRLDESTSSSVIDHSPNRMPAPAIGVVSAGIQSVAWHSSDTAEDHGVLRATDASSGEPTSKSTETEVRERDEGTVNDTLQIQSSVIRGRTAFGNSEAAESIVQIHGVAEQRESALYTSTIGQREADEDDMDIEELDKDTQVLASDEDASESPSFGTVADGQIEGAKKAGEGENLSGYDDVISTVSIDIHDYSARLKEIFRRESHGQFSTNRILKAIALDEGSDAILEALATTGEFDEELLNFEPPPTVHTKVAPSPSTSDSGFLDVLYSRDQANGFSTPKKTPPTRVNSTPSSPYTTESKEERLAAILRRTPQKATASHSKIINNSKPEDILEAEFGGCSDELGLFGDYRYPSVSATQFSSGMMGTPTRTGSAFGNLPSPSFTSSSFTSPPPKENPLKRSAAAIAKTPPVVLPKSLAASKPVMPSTANPVVQVPTPQPTPVPVPSMPAPLRTKTTPSRLPPSRTTSALPRPTLASPSTLTSRLRAPSSGVAATPTPAPTVTRARSFTANNDVRSTGATPSTTTTVPSSGLARTQSMLPRKSALQAPSPLKFGITRTNSMTASGGVPPASTAAADTAADPRRLSFGFSRPSFTKKA